MKGKSTSAKQPGKSLVWRILTGVFAVLFLFFVIGGVVANNFASVINIALNTESTKTIGDPGEIYFTADFASSKEQVANAEAVCESVAAGGITLMQNANGALPLNEGAKVSLFGTGAAKFVYGGTGSGGMDTSSAASLRESLETAGFSVNPTLWDFYTTGAGKDYGVSVAAGALNNNIADNSGFLVNEVPQSVYTSDIWDSVNSYGDAAIVVFSRICGEGRDLPFYGSGDGTDGDILSLSSDERALLQKLADLKSAGAIQKIVILLNGSNPFEMDFMSPEICGVDYSIDACLWVGEVGQTGINAIGKILKGAVNPSGRLPDTYCYDNQSSPAMQNNSIVGYLNGEKVGLSYQAHNLFYEVYQEGIYVGYRYYETRYEDYVLNNPKVGEYDYAATVAYPFGYGLSYSEFSYGPLNMQDAGDKLKFQVDVTNTSSVDASHSVLIYMQSPYTDYDRQNGVEKAAVELVGFVKVAIPAGETVSAEVSVDKAELRAYDANGAKTYILDAGNYYFATGNGAHEALNNILAVKSKLGDSANGSVDMSRLVGGANAALAVQYQQAELDTSIFSVAKTGMAITNQLDHADLNKFDDDASNNITYVSRNDWAGTMPQAKITSTSYTQAVLLEANETMVNLLSGPLNETTGEGTMPTMGAEGNLRIAQFVGVERDGSVEIDGVSYTWDDLLDQITFDEMNTLIAVAYHRTAAIRSIGKPATRDENGPMGVSTTLMGGGSSTSYTSADLLAATFDVDVAYAVGRSMGNDALMSSSTVYSGIYGPGANIHRTPYNGRNFEYYSEDPFVSGMICASEVQGIQSKGVYAYVKHFALNDQETGRDGLCVWTNEQAAREIYLQVFEYAIVDGGASNVMSSFNRLGCIWSGGDKNLMTNILRGEWDLQGFAVTDASSGTGYMDIIQGLLAGSDCWDCSSNEGGATILRGYRDNPQIVNLMRNATKNILYTVANSNAMNGISPNMQVVEVRTWWQNTLVACDIVFGLALAGSIFMLVRSRRKRPDEP